MLQAWDFRPGENFVVQMRRALDTAERTLATSRGQLAAGEELPDPVVTINLAQRGDGRRAPNTPPPLESWTMRSVSARSAATVSRSRP